MISSPDSRYASLIAGKGKASSSPADRVLPRAAPRLTQQIKVYSIKELLRHEAELKTCEGTSPACQAAKANILKYLQVRTVTQFEQEYDDLYFQLNKRELECLHSIVPVRSKGLLQPKLLERHGRGEDDKLDKQLQFYLANAGVAKQRLDELVTKIAQDSSKFEVQCVEVKSPESTLRKASRFCDKDVRKVADMARVSVICATPEALKEMYLAIMGLPKVRMCGFPGDLHFCRSCCTSPRAVSFEVRTWGASSVNSQGLFALCKIVAYLFPICWH